jgi:MinD-like ATPase involved in chromosome partitioning or flagellar assembly
LAQKGKNVCIIDNDFHGPSIHTFFKPNGIWINDYLLGNEKVEDTLQHYSTEYNLSGQFFIGFANPSAESVRKITRIEESTSFRMLEKLLTLKNTIEKEPYNVEYLIIDCSPGAHYTTLNAMLATDSSLFIVKLSNADIVGTSYMISGLYDQLKSRSLVLANFIPENITNDESKAEEIQQLMEVRFARDIGDKIVEFLGWIPIDLQFLNIEFEQALQTLRDQEFSRVILTLDQPAHPFSKKIIEIIPKLFGEHDLIRPIEATLQNTIKRLKIFVVGEPSVGKTALYHAIAEGDGPNRPDKLDSTAGIDRYDLWEKRENNSLRSISWWDFAGQYAYRDTHKLFLTEDALFVLVMNLRDSLIKNHASYWFQSIREKAPSAKILPILTHHDEVKDQVLGLTSTEDWQQLKDLCLTYNAENPIKVSNTEGTNINKVKKVIENVISVTLAITVPPFYFELEDYLKECEEKIFISLDGLIDELELHFKAKPEYSKEKLIEILQCASTHGLIQILELPSSPNIAIFDIDRVNKVIALLIDQAKKSKGFMQEIDILNVCADFFPREKRREAAKIFTELMVNINIALAIPERSSTGQLSSSLFIPHASEKISKKQASKYYPPIFVEPENKIGDDLAFFSFQIESLDKILPARILGHLLNYIPYSEANHIWREYNHKKEKVTALVAVLHDEETPIIHFKALFSENSSIQIDIVIADLSLEKGLFAAIHYALGKYGTKFELLKTQFIKIDYYSTESDDLIERLNQLSKIPGDYLHTIHQAINIINSSPASFIVTAGTALEKMFLDLYSKKIGEPNYDTKFWEILKALYEAELIPRPVKIWADTIRLHRNNCAHNITPTSSRDAIIVLEEILYILEWYNTLLLKETT